MKPECGSGGPVKYNSRELHGRLLILSLKSRCNKSRLYFFVDTKKNHSHAESFIKGLSAQNKPPTKGYRCRLFAMHVRCFRQEGGAVHLLYFSDLFRFQVCACHVCPLKNCFRTQCKCPLCHLRMFVPRIQSLISKGRQREGLLSKLSSANDGLTCCDLAC